MRKDTTKHPFEVRFSTMLKTAQEHAKIRARRVQPKVVPDHISVKADEYDGRFGMYNNRLDQWVKEEYQEHPRTFRTPEDAIDWYKSLI